MNSQNETPLKPALPRGFSRSALAVIEIMGKDAQNFLQRTTSQDFRKMADGAKVTGAFLTGIGGVIGRFWAQKRGETFLLAVHKKSLSKLFQQIEKLHFGEDLKYLVSNEYVAMEVFGAELEAPHDLASFLDDETQVVFGAASALENFRTSLKGYEEWNEVQWQHQKTLRFQPVDQVDLTETNIILEAGLVGFVHRNKGCYPGQEVVERIYTYGNIPRKFVQLETDKEVSGGDIFIDDQKVGRVTSSTKRDLPPDSTYVANGYLLRLRAMVGTKVRVVSPEGQTSEAWVRRVSPDLNKDVAT